MPKIKPTENEDLARGILEAVDLDSYRLSRTTIDNIKLKGDEELNPTPPIMKGKKGEYEFNELTTIVNDFNQRYGIDNWTDDYKVKAFLFEQLPADLAKDVATQNAVKNSDKQNAKITADKKVEDLMQEGYAYPAFPNMQDFIHQKFSINKEDSITFESLDVAAQIVEKAIKNKEKLPDTKYMAIYISPVSKINATPQNKNVYYRIKETLLQHSITSQVIYTDNISKSDFKFYLPNIEIAILAKLGGIPWRLNRTTNHELIVGIGAFYSTTYKSRFVGSAFCFNNEGNFKGFDCFGGNDTDMLAGSIREAVGKFIASNYKATRLIIHFYKDLSKKELKPILDTLRALGLGIPVIVVTINKTESKELLAFDTSSPNLMPYSGTIVKIGWQEYLLFNNTRYDATSQPSKKEYHFPVKLSFFCSQEGLLDDMQVIEQLVDQVYQFSRMYWKSVSQQNLPVTIKYPEMVAEIYPYFKYDKLPEFAKENLWFL